MKKVPLAAAPAAAAVLYFALAGSGLSDAGRGAAATGLVMAVWWITEALPLPATALLPLAVFPALGTASMKEAAAPYAHKLIFLFMGGFMIAAAMEKWGLHRRLALGAVSRVGARPARIVGAFMAVTALASMWISNTATALMMLAIAVSVVEIVDPGRGSEGSFGPCLALGIAYAASIGGMGTLIGTPPNALLAAFMDQQYGETVSFAGWMGSTLPFVAVLLPAAWLLLTRWVFPLPRAGVHGADRLLTKQREALGPMRPAEARVLAVFGATAFLWCFRPVLASRFPSVFGSLDDAQTAILGALALFLVHSGDRDGGPLLDWKAAEKIPWGILLLFGGGLSLASAISKTGLAEFLGGSLSGLRAAGPWPSVIGVTVLIVFLTELTSNTATTAAFLPVLAAAAAGAGIEPRLLLFPAAIGASCAFMMPVATPPNAIVFSSGLVTIRQMARAGLLLNLISIALIVLWAAVLL